MHPELPKGSNFQLHGLPILASKLALSSFLPTRIIQLTCSRMSLQKQRMYIAHNELLHCTTISAIICSKSDLLCKRTAINLATVGIPSVIDSIDNNKSLFYLNLQQYCLNLSRFFFFESIKARGGICRLPRVR